MGNHRDRSRRGPGSTRRDFLHASCLCAAGVGISGFVGIGAACSTPRKTPDAPSDEAMAPAARPGLGQNPIIAYRADPGVFAKNGHDDARVRALVNNAVTALVDVKDPREAFAALFEPKDVVAIKVNCLAGPGMSSSVSVVNALVMGLRSIGIQHRDIIIWERSSAELERVGFKLNRYSDTAPLCYGNDEGGFENKIVTSGEVGSLWSRVLAHRASALINVPVLKDHDLSGVGCGMKNMYGAIHNPNRYHDNNCDPFVADVNAHPYVKDRLRLVLADALTAQYHGGPARVASHQWRPGAVIAGADPVALDAVAKKLIEEERSKHGMATLKESKRPPKWLETASARGLGEHRIDKIRLNEG